MLVRYRVRCCQGGVCRPAAGAAAVPLEGVAAGCRCQRRALSSGCLMGQDVAVQSLPMASGPIQQLIEAFCVAAGLVILFCFLLMAKWPVQREWLALHQNLPDLLQNLLRNPVEPDLVLLPDLLQDLFWKLLRNPVEPELALCQGFLDPPEPSELSPEPR
jgi:hypothetical protein